MTDTTATPPRTAHLAGLERAQELERLERLAGLLDARFRVPLTGFRVGLDGLVGLVPVVGDTVAALPSAYMILRGWQLGARKRVLSKMMINTGIDYVIGSVPLFGDLFDLGFKGNLRNAALLRAEFGNANRHSQPGRGRRAMRPAEPRQSVEARPSEARAAPRTVTQRSR